MDESVSPADGLAEQGEPVADVGAGRPVDQAPAGEVVPHPPPHGLGSEPEQWRGTLDLPRQALIGQRGLHILEQEVGQAAQHIRVVRRRGGEQQQPEREERADRPVLFASRPAHAVGTTPGTAARRPQWGVPAPGPTPRAARASPRARHPGSRTRIRTWQANRRMRWPRRPVAPGLQSGSSGCDHRISSRTSSGCQSSWPGHCLAASSSVMAMPVLVDVSAVVGRRDLVDHRGVQLRRDAVPQGELVGVQRVHRRRAGPESTRR